jgi:hypothetical protein
MGSPTGMGTSASSTLKSEFRSLTPEYAEDGFRNAVVPPTHVQAGEGFGAGVPMTGVVTCGDEAGAEAG